jgi:hypothetical protein
MYMTYFYKKTILKKVNKFNYKKQCKLIEVDKI